ncbi:mitochondrial 39-S ribosomal protein L47 (MRP-L47)-domain-containing protein [Globomyces pollinis-pini]|nr:mitochondrial 39-S ribosomal protein L47 (MRP-L47)-domain-containing protein [Globomyces pollinis-pini]
MALSNGLRDFFDNPNGWIWKEDELPTGRAWLASELRNKSFEDLHGLWWVCLKERNKLASQKQEARRFQLFFPHTDRVHQVKLTMARIKIVLWERRIAFLQAKEVLKQESQKIELKETLKGKELISQIRDLEETTPVEMVGRQKRRAYYAGKKRVFKLPSRPTSWTVV